MDTNTGAKAVETVAEQVEKNEMSVDALADIAYGLRNERLQKMFDWFSEDTQRDLLRADDRTFIMKFAEKWAPQLDYKTFNIPKSTLRSVLSVLATFGAIEVKPEILEDMRGTPGMGILDIPDPALNLALKLLGIPEAYPLIKAAKTVENAKDSIAVKVRTRVKEKVMAKEVVNNADHFEDEETGAAGIKKAS